MSKPDRLPPRSARRAREPTPDMRRTRPSELVAVDPALEEGLVPGLGNFEIGLLVLGTAAVVGLIWWASSDAEGTEDSGIAPPPSSSGDGDWLSEFTIPVVEPSSRTPLEDLYLNCDYESVGLPRGTKPQRFRAVQPALLDASQEFGVGVDLLNAIAWQESRFDIYAESPAGAQGLMQLMPSTGRSLYKSLGISGEYDPFDPDKAARAAALYMRRRLDHYDRRFPAEPHVALYFAVASYNTGQGNVDKFLDARDRGEQAQLHPETRDYTPKVLGVLPSFTRLLEACT